MCHLKAVRICNDDSGLIPNFVTEFGYVSRLVSGAHNTINVTSIEEERVGTFIQNPSALGFYIFVTFLEVLTRNILLRL